MSLLDAHALVFITGVSAAGKTTVADELARRFRRGVHVKGDVFRRMVVSGRHEMTTTPTPEAWAQLRLRYRLGAQAANDYHRNGFSVVLQDVVIGDVLSEYVSQLTGRPLVVVVLAPSPEVVVEREANRAKTAYRAPFDDVHTLDRVLRDGTPRLGMWLDTSTMSPTETVDLIVERGLREGSVP